MNGFLAKLLFHIDIDHHIGPAQFDEQVRLVLACDAEAAWQKATEMGKADEDEFTSQSGYRIHWKFVATLDVFPLPEAGDGQVLFSHTHETAHAGKFIDEALKRSHMAREWHEQTATQPA